MSTKLSGCMFAVFNFCENWWVYLYTCIPIYCFQAIIREGILTRTKITENGKKIRKNWMSTYAVLTETFLLFYKDVKTFNAMVTTILRNAQLFEINA